ncbi:MAG: B12-binding domain-containing radical SAM protein [Myxococcales bacterium]|nr:B12-binding domain-containing radical SAM protein [Myxococcales bacterium]
MKVRIVVAYQPRYRRGHGVDFVPPITGIHLAALTPQEHSVELVHEQVRAVPDDGNADLLALSFFSGFARSAYAHADRARARGLPVVAGGPHVSYWVDEALEHVDAVVIGEADDIWPRVLEDAARGCLKRVYRGGPHSMRGLPTPRYDLLEDSFVVRHVLQATRGCPFSCRFCTVPDLNPGFRVRPIDDVLRDLSTAPEDAPWHERLAWFWDDNLLVKRRWAKELLGAMRGLGREWLTQASIDITHDDELLDLMERSGCIGIFLGIESLDAVNLESVDKRQNHVNEYARAIQKLHDRGIAVMAGFISGFDAQTEASIADTADRLNAIGVDVPFLSIMTPFRGTPLYDDLLRSDRILRDRDWGHYNGYNVAFRPARMSPEALLGAHRAMWRRAFSPSLVAERLARAAKLRPGAFRLALAMNGFYGAKAFMGNGPRDAPVGGKAIAHAAPDDVRPSTLRGESARGGEGEVIPLRVSSPRRAL